LGVPSALDLFSGTDLTPPASLRGIYVNRDNRQDIRMRVAYQAPCAWSWFHADAPPSGFVSDGNLRVVVEDGSAAVITTEGTVHTSSRLMSLLNPRLFTWDGSELSVPVESIELERPSWVVRSTATIPGKEPITSAFDAETGIVLFMRSKSHYLGFQQIELNEPIDNAIFTWQGPVDERKIGVGFVARRADGMWDCSWEITVRQRSVFDLSSSSFPSSAKATAWAECRSLKVVVREDTT
jgi:hypothetical protein